MNVNNEITSLKEHLLYLDKTDDRHYIDKIVELYEKGVDEQTLQSIFWQRYEIEDWLRDKSLEGKDYTVLYKENEKGIFRSTTYKTEDVKQVWLSTIVAEDEDVTINMPTSFEEAHMLGMVGWCFCDNAGWWSQHTNPLSQDGLGEAIYFIHDILQANPDDYVTDMVKRDGSHEILNRKHHHLNVSRYLRSIGDMANKLVPTTMEITESKTNKNMKKNVVKINENTLRQIVAESVKKVLNEDLSSSPMDLPNTLRDMAAYLEDSCDKSEYRDYWQEIVATGLFHDACGKPNGFDDSGNLDLLTDY